MVKKNKKKVQIPSTTSTTPIPSSEQLIPPIPMQVLFNSAPYMEEEQIQSVSFFEKSSEILSRYS
jgi:hypothetical protein